MTDSKKTVTVSSDWLRSILKKAKMEWPKELKEHEDVPECLMSPTGRHEWSEKSNPPFCIWCAMVK